MHAVIARTQRELIDHIMIRGKVFVVEQNIDWALEMDEDDYRADLFVLYDDDQPIGAARLVDDKVGRVAVLKTHRHKKAGTKLMHAVEAHAKRQGIKTLKLGAQTYIIPFYESLDYEAYGDIYLDADIEHRMMKKHL